MGNVPAIPESTRSSITLRILLHAKEHWPQLGRLEVTCRGGFAYAAASPSGDDKPHPLFRLRYGGSARSFGFAVYSSATGRYENSVLLTGRHTGTPQEALDTAATFYTAGITGPNPDTEPPKDLRSQPLRTAAGFCLIAPICRAGRPRPVLRTSLPCCVSMRLAISQMKSTACGSTYGGRKPPSTSTRW